MHDVTRGEGEGDVGLLEVVANGYFSAEGITPARDAEGVKVIGIGLDKNRDVKAGELDGVEHAFFIAEVGEDDENAVDDVAISCEEVCAFASIGMGFNSAELGLFGREHNGADGGGIEKGFDVVAGLADEDVGVEVAIADDDAKGDGGVPCGHFLNLRLSTQCDLFIQ